MNIQMNSPVKVIMLCCLFLLLGVDMTAQNAIIRGPSKQTNVGKKKKSNPPYKGSRYVDMGLPSGTRWKTANEGGLYDYDSAMSKYGNKLPTLEQWEELKDSCKWMWTGNAYKVTGKSGNSIILPAAGYRYCSGDVGHVGTFGNYWSSTFSDSAKVWSLSFYSDKVYVGSCRCCSGQSVRLVQNK